MNPNSSSFSSAKPPSRFLALDILRGLTVAFMLVVNNPGSWGHIYAPLKHPEWNGFTSADLIFPVFLFLVGLSTVLSFHKRREKGETEWQLFLHVLWRFLVLFFAGLFLHLIPDFDFSKVRIPGVLQRIAIVYLAISVLILFHKKWLIPSFFGMVLLGYSILFQTIPTPDWNPSVLVSWSPTMSQNWQQYIDSQFLKGHLWVHTRTWDPEGILSTFPAICSAILGAGVGTFFLSHNASHRGRVNTVLFISGVWLYAWGWVLGEYFPINKSIWSSSFVLFTAGIACVILSLLTTVFHRKKLSPMAKFIQGFSEPFGRNAFLAFFLSGLVSRLLTLGKWISFGAGDLTHLKQAIYREYFLGIGSPHFSSFLYSLAYLLVFYVLFYLLGRAKIFVKI